MNAPMWFWYLCGALIAFMLIVFMHEHLIIS